MIESLTKAQIARIGTFDKAGRYYPKENYIVKGSFERQKLSL